MRYRENTSADVVMSSQKNTYRMFKNTEVMYKKRKELPDWKRMLIVSKKYNNKRGFYMFTTTTILFTTYKRVGFCTTRKDNKIVISTWMSNIELYLKELVWENYYFWCPVRTKMQCKYQNLLKEVNGNHKYLRCTYLRHNNFEVLHLAIKFYKIDLVCSETVKYKPNRNG